MCRETHERCPTAVAPCSRKHAKTHHQPVLAIPVVYIFDGRLWEHCRPKHLCVPVITTGHRNVRTSACMRLLVTDMILMEHTDLRIRRSVRPICVLGFESTKKKEWMTHEISVSLVRAPRLRVTI